MLSLEFAVCSAVSTLREQGLHEAALELATLSLSEDGDQGQLWELTGLILTDRQLWREALSALETASSLVPLTFEGQCRLADCYAWEGRQELARDLYCSLVEQPGLSVESLLAAAAGLDRLGRPDMAVQVCRKAANSDMPTARTYYEMAYYMRRCGYPPHLVESMARQAVRLDPESVSYRVGLAAVLHQQGRIEEAYDLVSELTCSQLRRIQCPCCLERLLNVCERCEDDVRGKACQAQLQNLMILDPHISPRSSDKGVRID